MRTTFWRPEPFDSIGRQSKRMQAHRAHQLMKPTKCAKRLKSCIIVLRIALLKVNASATTFCRPFSSATFCHPKQLHDFFYVFQATFWSPKIAPRLFAVLFCIIFSSISVGSQKRTRKSRQEHFGQQNVIMVKRTAKSRGTCIHLQYTKNYEPLLLTANCVSIA